MRFFGAILALALVFSPLAMAKDQAEKGLTDRNETPETQRGADSNGLDSDGVSREVDDTTANEAEKPEPTEELPSTSDEDGSTNADTTDKTRVRATTATVPVESLGIVPSLAPIATPGPKTREAQTRKVRIGKIGAAATEAAKARKARSEETLRTDGVPLNLKLPVIVDAGQTTGRTHRQVVGRTLAILATAVKGEGLDQEVVEALIDDFGVRSFLTPEEASFIENENPTTIDRVQFAWRYEAAWTMLWALSAVEELSPPREIVDVRSIGAIVRGENIETMIEKTTLRPMDDLLDEADLIYRYRWALVDARVNDREPPAGLDPGVALERHRALNWLIGYLGQEWDDVTPDT